MLIIYHKKKLIILISKVAGKVVLDLNDEGTHAEPADADDRRSVLHVISPVAKKSVSLPANTRH